MTRRSRLLVLVLAVACSAGCSTNEAAFSPPRRCPPAASVRLREDHSAVHAESIGRAGAWPTKLITRACDYGSDTGSTYTVAWSTNEGAFRAWRRWADSVVSPSAMAASDHEFSFLIPGEESATDQTTRSVGAVLRRHGGSCLGMYTVLGINLSQARGRELARNL